MQSDDVSLSIVVSGIRVISRITDCMWRTLIWSHLINRH